MRKRSDTVYVKSSLRLRVSRSDERIKHIKINPNCLETRIREVSTSVNGTDIDRPCPAQRTSSEWWQLQGLPTWTRAGLRPSCVGAEQPNTCYFRHALAAPWNSEGYNWLLGKWSRPLVSSSKTCKRNLEFHEQKISYSDHCWSRQPCTHAPCVLKLRGS